MLGWIDYIIIAVIGLSILTGLFRGFVKESMAIVIWGLGIWLGLTYTQLLSPWLSPYVHDAMLRSIAGFLIILLLFLLIGGIINALLGHLLHRTGLSGTDRLLGMAFGFIRGVFIISLMILILNMTSLGQKEDYQAHSVLYSKLTPVVNWLGTWVPHFIDKAKQMQEERLSPASEEKKS